MVPSVPALSPTSPRFFDCVSPDFLDEGGGQRMCQRLWRLILSMKSMITINHAYRVTNHELHRSSTDLNTKLIHSSSSCSFHARHSCLTDIRIPFMEILRYSSNLIPSSPNIPPTHQFIHHRFLADHIHDRLIVKSNRQKNARKPERPGVTGDG